MVFVGKYFVLSRQERAAGIHKIYAWQVVLRRNFLRSQVFLHCNRIVGTAFDSRIVGNDHTVDAVHLSDARDDARCRDVVVIHVVSGKATDFEER